MNALIVRYEFQDPNPVKSSDMVELLKRRYGGALHFLAVGTIFIDTLDTADQVFDYLSPHFTFDDKLFIGKLEDFRSIHNISRVKPTVHRIA